MLDLRPDHLQIVQRLLSEIVPECEVRAYGSRVKGTAAVSSDLDLALVGPKRLHWKPLTKLRAAFEESNLPFRVDVLDWHAISPSFQQEIEQGYEVIQKARLEMRVKP
ncbi:MAG: nucleotidyltransferase domain-containing protein [Anaerolineales bacterium]